MTIDWSDGAAIAEALIRRYPDRDRLSLDDSTLLSLIFTLDLAPQLSARQPTPQQLNHIRWTWMRLADQPPAERKAG